MRIAIVAGALLVYSTFMSAQSAPPPAQAVTGDAAAGRQLFMKNTCFFCHGTVGQGAGIVGARIGPPTRNLNNFIRYVRRPSGAMPAFSEKVLPDRDLTDIYAYLRGIPPPKAPKDILLLNQLKQE